MPTSIHLESELEQRLDQLAARTGRSRAFLLRELIVRGLDDLEDIYLAAITAECVRKGEEAVRPAASVRMDLALDETGDQALPVELKRPNVETRTAMREAAWMAGQGQARFADADDLFFDLANLGPLTEEQRQELERLAAKPDSEIDYSDAPVLPEAFWQEAVRGRFYKPTKTSTTVRIDSDVLAWLKGQGKGYQTRINAILRCEMLASSK